MNPVQAAEFVERIRLAQRQFKEPQASNLHLFSPEEYASMRLFLTPDRLSGFAIQDDGTLTNVFSYPHGRGDSLVSQAVELGATKLDCFDVEPLTSLYRRHGFREVGRLKWDDQYAPRGWRKGEFGTPDVVLMELA